MKSYCIKNLTASLLKRPFLALVFIDNHIINMILKNMQNPILRDFCIKNNI